MKAVKTRTHVLLSLTAGALLGSVALAAPAGATAKQVIDARACDSVRALVPTQDRQLHETIRFGGQAHRCYDLRYTKLELHRVSRGGYDQIVSTTGLRGALFGPHTVRRAYQCTSDMTTRYYSKIIGYNQRLRVFDTAKSRSVWLTCNASQPVPVTS